jgi:hypothetical protein
MIPSDTSYNDAYEDVVTDTPEYAADDDLPESLQWGRHTSTTWYAKPLTVDDVFQELQDELPL